MTSLFLEILGGENGTPPPAELPRQGRLVIGSSPERATLVVTGQGVAEVHCTIGRIKGGGWALRDMGSEFGTIVNGERVDTARLSAGDVILLGSRKLRIFDPKQSSAADGAAAAPDEKPEAKPKPTPKLDTKPAPKPAGQPAKKAPPAPARKAKSKKDGLPVISGYDADRLLGHGSMGDVFLATQESLQRRVALKILKSKLANNHTFVERFRQEARAAARLNHPNIVTVYDVGEDGGKHFLSMEFMAGGSIEARLVELGPLPWREALDVVRDAAAGLVYAESRGIVHRDIKPENLMRNQDGVTKIADLGLAIQVEQEIVDGGGGKIFGTPHFIAPEVIRGQPSDARSDLYSLGVTAYRILSGHTPFEGGTSRDILRSALSDEPARLGSRVPGLPPAFEAVIHRLLEKDPEARPPSAAVLLTELERMRQGDGLTASPTATGSNKTVILVVGGVVIAAIIGFALSRGGGDRNPVDDGAGFRSTRDSDVDSAAGAAIGSGGDAGQGTTPVGDTDGAESDPETTQTGGDGISGSGTATEEPDSGAISTPQAEVEVEYEAQLAYQKLADELLTPEERAARLRALAEQFAGTDTARNALTEAEQLTLGAAAADSVQAQRQAGIEAALTALRAAADVTKTPFHPGQALRAMRYVEGQENFADDAEFVAQRDALVDEVLKLGIARGQAAQEAADAAEAAGDFAAIQEALRPFIAITDLPTAEDAPLLVGPGAPESLAEFKDLGVTIRQRLEDLAGREGEFEAARIQKEWAAMADRLGGSLELTLRDFDLASASERVGGAAGLVSDEALKADLTDSAADLLLADSAIQALLSGWTAPGWRRRGVTDPRPGHSKKIDAVGVAAGAILLDDGSARTTVPMRTWCGETKALESLFRGRLSRDWTADEKRGILVLLTVSATVEALADLEPSMQSGGRALTPTAVERAISPFDEAFDWAKGDADLLALARRQSDAVEALAAALIAREKGDWGLSAALFRRLLDEGRGTWIVMLLSDGGRR